MTGLQKILLLSVGGLVLAVLLMLTAPVSIWLSQLELPGGVELNRMEGSLLRGELVLSMTATGADKPVFLSWDSCENTGWQRCWRASGQALQGEGKIALWPGGGIDIYDSQLQGDMVLTEVFLLPISGSWQANVQQLSFHSAACLPAEIETVEADIELQEGRAMQFALSPHTATIIRLPGEAMRLALSGYNASGLVTLDAAGNYTAELELRLPNGILPGPLNSGLPAAYNLQQQGVLPCM